MTAPNDPVATRRTPRRWVVLAFGGALFGVTAAGLIVAALVAESAGQGGKAGWVWSLPFAALLALLPCTAFAITLAGFARGGVALPPAAALRSAALLGGVIPAVLLVVKPVLRWFDIGGGLIGGLAVSQIGLGLLAIAAAAWIAVLRPPR